MSTKSIRSGSMSTTSSSFFRRCWYDVSSPLFWHDVIFEAVITGSIVCGVIFVVMNLNPEIYTKSTTHFAFCAITQIFSYADAYSSINRSLFNPAVLFTVFIAGRITFTRTLFYTIAEIGGAAAGAMIAFGLTPVDYQNRFMPITPSQNMLDSHAMVVEAILTFNLALVTLCVTDSRRAHPMPFLPIAFCAGSGLLAAGTYSGGIQNPIVAFGPALVTKNFTHHWVYWVGPYIGALLASVAYRASDYMKANYQQNKDLNGVIANGDASIDLSIKNGDLETKQI